MAYNSFSAIAGGSTNINTCCFVSLGTAADNTVVAATGTTPIIGVSPDAAQNAPIPGAGTYAAAPGDQINVQPIGSVALVRIGASGVTRGDYLVSDSSGNAQTCPAPSGTEQFVGGQALESASSGELCKVLIHAFSRGAA